ncbi:MAG: hypothetical protein DCC68_20910 [Planctomycetota bacterium]|nr:MAG: hypothetical protein DCC68_20910 [Planctomycetota bacterium]
MVRVRSHIAIVADDGPNPAKSPGVLGPVEALVYLDPTWAGTMLIWIASSIALVVAFAIAAAVFWPNESSARAVLRLRIAAFAAGMPLAWPWISVLFRG